ncbi:protein of unknown function (plasmid) [Cupriavidus taiwanensis]|uniref:Uncharacterized protein n=1 Tax=Cupriavidus taiwanensis TaxID=164546 RepID=A0A375IT41_9BURK|nr:TniB family NTP-binding protein [Cupriavidus taiwanensis]SPK77270.1 protein of unknown function [Cupriavidus taiwanensis]
MTISVPSSEPSLGEMPSDFASRNLFGGESPQKIALNDPDWLNNALALASLNGPSKSEVDDVMRLWIETETAEQAMKAIDCLIERAKTTRMPGGLRLSGEGGTGKTFILHRILKKYRAVDNGFLCRSRLGPRARHGPEFAIANDGRPAKPSDRGGSAQEAVSDCGFNWSRPDFNGGNRSVPSCHSLLANWALSCLSHEVAALAATLTEGGGLMAYI